MTKRLLILLLLATPAFGANETVRPDGLTEVNVSWRDQTDAGSLDVQYAGGAAGAESWQSYDATISGACEDSKDTGTQTLKVDFAAPSANPVATTDAQTIRITFRKGTAVCAGNIAKNDPTVTVRIYDGSSEVEKITSYSCAVLTADEQTFNFTYNGGSDGTEVYLEMDDEGNAQTSNNSRTCILDYVEWYADVAGAADDSLMVVSAGRRAK